MSGRENELATGLAYSSLKVPISSKSNSLIVTYRLNNKAISISYSLKSASRPITVHKEINR